VHEAKAAPSSEHSNVANSLAEKAKLGFVLLLGFGGAELIVVLGAVVSIVHV
jgi:hypothetical protein